jgi:hypothetical protein
VLGIIVFATLTARIGLKLPVALVWASPLIGVTGVLALDQIAKVAAYTGPGESVAGGTRLFACVSVLFAEFVYYFVSAARGEGFLWDLFIGSLCVAGP